MDSSNERDLLRLRFTLVLISKWKCYSPFEWNWICVWHKSLVSFCRDDLYRVELDNMAGDEMFYSKV